MSRFVKFIEISFLSFPKHVFSESMDNSRISYLTGVVCGVIIGISIYYIQKYIRESEEKNLAEKTVKYSDDGDYRIALLVRTDLGMSKGKIAAQCGHAAVGAIETAQIKCPDLLRLYRADGQTKIILKVDSEKTLKKIRKLAKDLEIITSTIKDAGRTQIAPNTITVLALGPAPREVVEFLTDGLLPL